jgi:hypothetical protein
MTGNVTGKVTSGFLKLKTDALGEEIGEMEQNQVEGPVTVNVNDYLVEGH